MRSRLALAAVIIALIIGGDRACAADPRQRIVVGGVTRSYYLHLPAARPAGPLPLVLAFHGGGSTGLGMIRLTGLDALSDRDGFALAYPDGLGRRWNDGRRTNASQADDVGFTVALIDALSRQTPIDPRRVYGAGISDGGLFAERLACQLSDRIAATAATLPADLAAGCHPGAPVSVIQIDGTRDPIMPYDGGTVASFLGLGEGGEVLSVDDTVAQWTRIDRCRVQDGPEPLRPLALPDFTSVTLTWQTRCDRGAEVALYAVEGGGHAWPGGPQYAPARLIGRASRQLDASATIIRFFLAHPRG